MRIDITSAVTDERGAELVEFALVLPLLLVVFGGIVDFGLILQRHPVLSNAAREGARLAVLPDYTTDDVQSRVRDYVREGLSNSTANPTTTLEIRRITPGTGPAFDAARVQVTLRERFLVLGPIVNLAGGTWSLGSEITVGGTSTMRIEAAGGT
jgi:Flp pilus assembly protein TadG